MSVLPLPPRQSRAHWSAQSLLATDLPAPRWAIPGLIPEGLSLLVGSPKAGKSWLTLSLAVSVAGGHDALGHIPVPVGEVHLLALEDTARRLQQRLRSVLGDRPAPSGLRISTEWDRADEGGLAALDQMLGAHPATSLVIIDVLARFRGAASSKDGSAYTADYQSLVGLKRLADKHGTSVVVVHHVRKAGSEDFVATVSGTNGLAGAADAILALRRPRTEADGVLSITGRDVEEVEHALTFDEGTWTLLAGPGSEWAISSERRRVLQLLREHGAQTPKSVAVSLGLSHPNAKQLLRRMALAGQIHSNGRGDYSALSPLSPLSPQAPDLQLYTHLVSPEVSPTCHPVTAGDRPTTPSHAQGDRGDRGDTPYRVPVTIPEVWR